MLEIEARVCTAFPRISGLSLYLFNTDNTTLRGEEEEEEEEEGKVVSMVDRFCTA